MLISLLVSLLAQAPAVPVQRLGSVGFQTVGVATELGASLENTFATRVNESKRVRITTQRDLAALLGVERQKQLVGCAEASNACIAEIAAALGVEGLVTGEISRVGKTFQLTVKVLSSRDAHALFQSIRRFETEDDVLRAIDDVARDAVEALAPEPRSMVAPVVLAGVGGAVLIAGAVFQGLAAGEYATLRTSTELSSLKGVKAQGEFHQTLGITGLAVGGAVLATGVIWALVGASSPPPARVSVGVSAQGATFVLSGSF